MSTPTMSIAEARAAGACQDGIDRALGRITTDEDYPVPLSDVLAYSMEDALWALFVVDEVRWRHFALDCATRVLPIFEAVMPGDRRVRDCITFYRENPQRPPLWAARAAWAADAARAADAAWAADAAEAAAWAAWAAEADWAAQATRAAAHAAEAAAVAAWAAEADWAADAAEAAARAAERKWQEERLRKYLGARRPQPLPLPEVQGCAQS